MARDGDNEAGSREAPVAVFGGTFDPIHKGHLQVAEQVCEAGAAARVIFVPAGRPPHKSTAPAAPGEDRLAMVCLAIAGDARFEASACELRRSGPSYTIDTAAYFADVFGDRLRLLVGMDMFASLHRWHRGVELGRKYRFIVYRRPGWEMPSPAVLAERFGNQAAERLAAAVVDGPRSGLSSTAVRQACGKGGAPGNMLPAAVAQYIVAHGLYGARPASSAAGGTSTQVAEHGGS